MSSWLDGDTEATTDRRSNPNAARGGNVA